MSAFFKSFPGWDILLLEPSKASATENRQAFYHSVSGTLSPGRREDPGPEGQ